jgi:hypothetical protein
MKPKGLRMEDEGANQRLPGRVCDGIIFSQEGSYEHH